VIYGVYVKEGLLKTKTPGNLKLVIDTRLELMAYNYFLLEHWVFLRCVLEALLLKISNILEALNHCPFITNCDLWCNNSTILEDTESPVNSHQPDTYAIAHQHGYHSTSVCGRLVCSECLWANQVTDGVANV
jgi:hypothetical protein